MSRASKETRDRWYRNNQTRQNKKQSQRRRRLKVELMAHKRTLKCAKCDFDFATRPECCDFHHPDPNAKDKNVSVLARESSPRVWAEIEKCIPLCANCHRTIHVLKPKGE